MCKNYMNELRRYSERLQKLQLYDEYDNALEYCSYLEEKDA